MLLLLSLDFFFFFFPCDAKQISKLLMSSQDRLWQSCCGDGGVNVSVLCQGRDAL